MAIIQFALETPAAQMVEISTQPGATLKISGTDSGTAYTKTDYFATQDESGWYILDNGTSATFVINYLLLFAGSKGNGIGKISGTVDVDAGGIITVTATDVGGNSVAYTLDSGGVGQSIVLANPQTAGKIEYTTANVRYLIAPTPNDATIELIDSRDGTILPPVALFVTGFQYALPVLNTVGVPNDILYSIKRDNFQTATGKFTVTRTAPTSLTNTVTFSADGNEESHTYNDAVNPRKASISLVSLATDYDISFAVQSGEETSAVTAMLEGAPVLPDASGHFIVPFVAADTPFYYTITAPNFHTVNGELTLKPDGSVVDNTSQEEIDATINYSYDPSIAKTTVQLMPSLTLVITGEQTAVLPVGKLLPESFKKSLYIFGEKLTGGKMEFVNDTDKDYRIVGVEVTGRPTLVHNAFRTQSMAVQNLFGLQSLFSQLRDIVTHANAKYPGENFSDYYDYLLYYYKNIYVAPSGKDYSGITSLDELDTLDLSAIWTGNAWLADGYFDGTQADYDNGLVYEVAGPTYAYVENDPKIAALAEKLIAEHAFNLTFDDTKAGPIPISVPQMNEQNEGLQYLDYEEKTPKNLSQVAKMFEFVLPANSAYRLSDIAISSNGSYAHNGFINNALDFAFEINLLVELVKAPYVVKYYADEVSDLAKIGEVTGGMHPEGYELTLLDIENDLGKAWLDTMRPKSYLAGVLVGDLPIMSADEENVVTVLYARKPLKKSDDSGCRTEIWGRKIWLDNFNAGDTRPETVEIVLLRDGISYKTLTLKSDESGDFVFPCVVVWKNKEEKYQYTIDEATTPSGYTKSADGLIITNTLN